MNLLTSQLDYTEGLLILGACGVGLIVYCLFHHIKLLRKVKGLEGELMAKRGRAAHVKRRISDAINELFDQMEEKGTITNEEKLQWFQQIGNTGLTDLLPKRRQKSIVDLKEEIVERLTKQGVDVNQKIVQLRGKKKEDKGLVRKKYA